MAQTCIIVEGQLDEIVINKILASLGKSGFTIKLVSDEPDLSQPTKLINALEDIQGQISLGTFTKVAIIRDMDMHTITEREQSINLAINNAFGLSILPTLVENTAQFIRIPSSSPRQPAQLVEFICHFVGIKNANGNKVGEIDNLLKAIKQPSANSAIADCIDNCLPNCLKTHSIPLNNQNKALSKLWIYNFQRFDMGDPDEIFFNPTVDKNTRPPLKLFARDFHLMFDLNANIPELKELINCIKSIAQ